MKTKKRLHTTETNPPLPPAAFDATPRLALILTDETMYLTRFNERGEPLETHPVAANDVASAFNHFTASTGLLPPDILFWQFRVGRDRLAIWLPPAVHALSFAQGRRDVTIHVPLPGFVLVGEGIFYSIFAATERPSKSNDLLYRAPLPNVGLDGAICAGSVKFPKASAESLRVATTLFFESLFNADLSTEKVKSQGDDPDEENDEDEDDSIRDDDIINMVIEAHSAREPISLYQFLCGLEGKRSFPNDELVTSLTMGQLLGGKNANP